MGAGIFGAITSLVIADLMRGTGRFNVAQGAVATLQGIGAASSGLIAGVVVGNAGYSAAFFMAAIATVALATLILLMPETASPSRKNASFAAPLSCGSVAASIEGRGG